MTTISIPLSDGRRARLQALAEQVGMSAEDFLQHRVEQLLDSIDPQFSQALDHVLQKNAELYRRLS